MHRYLIILLICVLNTVNETFAEGQQSHFCLPPATTVDSESCHYIFPKVVVKVTVDCSGAVRHAEIRNKAEKDYTEYEKALVRELKNEKELWTPGRYEDRNVNTQVLLPFQFKPNF